jgi:hypothetical protein
MCKNLNQIFLFHISRVDHSSVWICLEAVKYRLCCEANVCAHVLPMTSQLFHVINLTQWISLLIDSTLK